MASKVNVITQITQEPIFILLKLSTGIGRRSRPGVFNGESISMRILGELFSSGE